MKRANLKKFGISAALMGLPLLAMAQAAPPPVGTPPPVYTGPSQLVVLICTSINWLFWLLIVLTIIFVLVAAFKYLTASGDPEKVKAAGSTLLYAAVAIAVALVAKGVPLIVSSFLGAGLTGTGC